MSLHDDYARVTPFEIAFPDRGSLEALSSAVEQEIAERGGKASVPEVFASLSVVDDFVRGLAGRESASGAARYYGVLAFHAVHFVRAGCPLYLLDAAVARDLVETSPAGVPTPPDAAGYLQLPQHLFWIERSTDGTPESMDGVFWTVTEGRLYVLSITGVRPERPGFGALSLPAAPLADAAEWLSASARETADDFSGMLPGGDLDELYSVETAGELLKLLARFFAYAANRPAALERSSPRGGGAEAPRPSALPYIHVKSAA